MEIKLRRAVVQYFAPIFLADVSGKGRAEGRKKEGGTKERSRHEKAEEGEEWRGAGGDPW